MTSIASEPQTLFPVPLAMLEPGAIVPCDLWLKDRRPTPVLYRARQLPFTGEHRDRLRESGVERLYVAFEDSTRWAGYLEERFHRRVLDHTRPAGERAAILVESSRSLMREVLEDPGADHARPRIESLAEAIQEMTGHAESLAATVRLLRHDYYTYTHSVHVAIYVTGLAQACGVDDPELIRAIARGGLMHDCGKVSLPSSVLNKKGKLDEKEWELVRAHPREGVRILQGADWQDEVVLALTELHHERIDGSGYPHGRGIDELPDVVRMIAICDAYDAITTDRPYEAAMHGADALAILKRREGQRYDQAMLETFIRMLLDPRSLRG